MSDNFRIGFDFDEMDLDGLDSELAHWIAKEGEFSAACIKEINRLIGLRKEAGEKRILEMSLEEFKENLEKRKKELYEKLGVMERERQ